jgi:molybdenum cofactor biosynthesis protein B
MAHTHHTHITPQIVTVTISDTRTELDDESGALLQSLLKAAGFTLVRHAIVKDEPEEIRALIRQVIEKGEADAVISTGGTGISPRDQTYEAIAGLLEKRIDGFGEAFRRLSWDEIGPRSILSRAIAGSCQRVAIVALPGHPNAVRLAVEGILQSVLPHLVAQLKK